MPKKNGMAAMLQKSCQYQFQKSLKNKIYSFRKRNTMFRDTQVISQILFNKYMNGSRRNTSNFTVCQQKETRCTMVFGRQFSVMKRKVFYKAAVLKYWVVHMALYI